MKSLRLWAGLAGLAIGPYLASAQPAPTAQANPRLTVVISDLHMGVGQDVTNKKCHTLEDFCWQEEFALFLKHIDAMGKGKTDLILNGDTFELWQSLTDDCPLVQKELGCTESQALIRLRPVLGAHEKERKAIGRFADAGDNRVILVPGNHDAALLFDKVGQAVLAAIPSMAGRVRIAKEGYWRSKDWHLYAEHGHQIGKTPNDENWSWPAPFTTTSGEQYLQRSKEERTLQVYFNLYEKAVPIVDNTPEEEGALRILLAAERESGASSATNDIFGFLLFKTMWKDLSETLNNDSSAGPPEWDIEKIKKMGDRFFVESFASDDPMRTAVEDAVTHGAFGLSLADLSPDEIVAICDQRAARLALQEKEKKDGKRVALTIEECLRKGGTLKAVAENLLRSRDATYATHLGQTRDRFKEAGDHHPTFEVFISAATHIADSGFHPRKKGWDPLVVNSGAWQRVAMKKDLDKLRARPDRKNLSDQEFLRSIKLEELPACYSAILVEPYTDKPEPKLRYWVKGEGGTWRFNEQCQ